MYRPHRLFLLLALVSEGEVAQGTCLIDAIPASQRQNLSSGAESYPVGLWSGNFESAYVTTSLVQILIQEKLGFNAELTGTGGVVSSFHALAGCTQPRNLTDRGCGPTVTYNHINTENWGDLYLEQWQEIQTKYASMAPLNLGSMGYTGRASAFVAQDVVKKAYYEEGVALDFYRNWNSSWSQPWAYFDSLSSINRNLFLPCEDTIFQSSASIEAYLRVTGDSAGVERQADGSLVAVCPDGFFWLAPTCRSDEEKCVPYATGGRGWALDEIMQKATAFDMPLAVGVAKEYYTIPFEIRTAFYWWVPDATFLDMQPVEIGFPRHNPQAFAIGDRRTGSTDSRITKLVSQDLSALAPSVLQLVQNLWLSMEALNEMLLDRKRTGDSYEEVACRWLRSGDSYKSWLPDKTRCLPGFGLFDSQRMDFVFTRDAPTYLECRTCIPGTYSARVDDSRGVTYACHPCGPGTMQPSASASACEPCPRGTFSNKIGLQECVPCRLGSYQDEEGATECKACPNGTTTLSLGSPRVAACGCVDGSIEVERGGAEGSDILCDACPPGLSCPVLSSLATLAGNGTSDADPPKLLAGYWSTELTPMVVYKCAAEEHCPGGKPGSCAGGRLDLACAECPADMNWQGGECIQCEDWIRGLWVLALVGLFLLLPLAGRHPQASSKPSPSRVARDLRCAAREVVALTAQALQTFALIRTISVPWPSSSLDTLLSALLLEVNRLGFGCLLPNHSAMVGYLLQAGFVPTACAWIVACSFATRLFSRWLPQQSTFLATSVNACGVLLMVFYETISNLALAPFMCYEHPNGSRSMLRHANVFCDSAQHAFMVAVGIVLGACLIAFLACCIWGVRTLPRWSYQQRLAHVAAFRFLFESYRLDAWWYGVPSLLVGPLLSLPSVVATDSPAIQVLSITALLNVHLLFLLLMWPWKVPLVNLVEAAAIIGAIFSTLSASLFLKPEDAMGFSGDFASAVRLLVLGACGVFLSTIGLGTVWLWWTDRERSYWWLDLAYPTQPKKMAQVLRSTAHGLTQAQAEVVVDRVGTLSTFDKQLLKSALSLLVIEVVPETSLKLHTDSDYDYNLSRMRSSTVRSFDRDHEQDKEEQESVQSLESGSTGEASVGKDEVNSPLDIENQVDTDSTGPGERGVSAEAQARQGEDGEAGEPGGKVIQAML